MNDPCVECDSLEQRNQFFRKLYPQLDHLNEPLGQPPEEVPKASADDQLHHAQMRFKRLSEATSEGIVIVHDGVIVDVNQQFADMHGYRMEELIGKDGFQLLDAASQEKVRRNLADGYQGFYELVAVKKDGSVFPIEVRVREYQAEGITYGIGVSRDISEHKAMEDQIAASEKRYRQLYEQSPIALYRTRVKDGIILECNQALVALLGYDSKEQLLGTTTVLSHYNKKQDRETLLKKLENNKRLAGFQVQLKQKDGTVLWVEKTVEIFPEHGYLEGAMCDVTASKLLSKAEKKVLRLIVEGLSNKRMAHILDRSIRTVEDHRANIMKKLQADNLVELIEKSRSLRSD